MSSLVISGDTSGQVTVSAPAVAGSNTLTLLAATATNSVNTLSTAVASTSGTSITFSSIPSWVKRVTVSLVNVQQSGTSGLMLQIGSGSVANTGYSASVGDRTASTQYTTGFGITQSIAAASTVNGVLTLVLQNSATNTWAFQGLIGFANTPSMQWGAGTKALSGALDRVVLTNLNGTDAFTAGSVNILYEG